MRPAPYVTPRARTVPEWTLHDGTDEHDACEAAPCGECVALAAATVDPERAA